MCFPSLFTPRTAAFSTAERGEKDSRTSARRFVTTASSRSHFNETTKTWEVSKEDAKRGNPRSQHRLKPNGRRGSRNTEVLIFPDAQMPCRSIVDNYHCRKSDCRYSHDTTSLVKFLRALDSAEETLDIVCFTITCDEIKRVIQRVAQRGVRVRIVSDANNVDSLGSDIRELSEARKIDVRCDAHSNDPNKRGMMHHKFAVIDGGKTVITGSFNWTRAGVLDNHDNVLIARNMPEVAEPYVEHMNQLWKEYAEFQIHGTDG